MRTRIEEETSEYRMDEHSGERLTRGAALMILQGTALNIATVLAGSILGSIAGSRMSTRLTDAAFRAIGLFTLVIGISMALQTQRFLLLAFSCIAGSVAGEALDLDAGLRKLGERIRAGVRFGGARFAEGMITAFLLFCMGSMTILGALQEGMGGSSQLLYTKALMDGVAAAMLASALGPGVAFSIIPLALYQGGLTILAAFAGESIPGAVVAEITAVGGVLLIGLGVELLGLRRLKVANMLPALVIAGIAAAVF
jgi:uncharacterized protein